MKWSIWCKTVLQSAPSPPIQVITIYLQTWGLADKKKNTTIDRYPANAFKKLMRAFHSVLVLFSVWNGRVPQEWPQNEQQTSSPLINLHCQGSRDWPLKISPPTTEEVLFSG